MKYTKEIIDSLLSVNTKAAELNSAAINGLNYYELFEQAMQLNDSLGNLILNLEDPELDVNMDPEKTKLPNLDEVFKDDPVTDYVYSIVNLARGEGSVEAVKAAAKKLENHQNGVKPEEKQPDTIDKFFSNICESIELEGEEATNFVSQLHNAVAMLKRNPGAYCEFMNGTVRGNVNVKGSVITIKLDEKTYTYDTEAQLEERKYDGFCCEYPTEPVEDAEELFNQLHKPFTTLGEYVTKYGFGEYDPKKILDTIQVILDQRIDNLSSEEYKLIRFYLKQKPFNDPEEIDTLSKRALELAWRRFMYTRKSMK